jgi:hypothetical protein
MPKKQISNLGKIQVICQNYIITSNHLFIFDDNSNMILVHPMVSSLANNYFHIVQI